MSKASGIQTDRSAMRTLRRQLRNSSQSSVLSTLRMTWLPSFLNPWMAAAAAGIAVPALLILYFLKLRRREMAVSSTLLWRKAIQDLQVNAPFQRLRRNLLLLLQLLLLVLLCLALSRPVSNFTPGAAKLS